MDADEITRCFNEKNPPNYENQPLNEQFNRDGGCRIPSSGANMFLVRCGHRSFASGACFYATLIISGAIKSLQLVVPDL